jgi:hypothetical protein
VNAYPKEYLEEGLKVMHERMRLVVVKHPNRHERSRAGLPSRPRRLLTILLDNKI